MKRCAMCRQLLEHGHFWRNKHKGDGLQDWCKGCRRGWRTSTYRDIERPKDRVRSAERRSAARQLSAGNRESA